MEKYIFLLKRKIKALIELIPYGYDLSVVLFRMRYPISYRGVYQNYSDAKKSIADKEISEYDIVNEKKKKNAEERLALDCWFHDIDYPLLFWLSVLLKDDSCVVELGGSLGHFYYSIQKFINISDSVSWVIYELPNAVEFGEKLAKERRDKRLTFRDSQEIISCKVADIFLTSGTLQYMESTISEILQKIESRPGHILIHNLPVHASISFVTVQILPMCHVPYCIYSENELLTAMKDLGYELVAKWKNERTIQIPFHRQMAIEGYLGFYFRRV